MALIKCFRCKARISDRAEFCPKCGADQRIECEDCHIKLPRDHEGACPECGNPEPCRVLFSKSTPSGAKKKSKADSFTFIDHPSESEKEEEIILTPEEQEAQLIEQENRALLFRLLVGLGLGLLSGFLLTEGFVRHGFLEFLPIMVIVAAIGMAYPRLSLLLAIVGGMFGVYYSVVG
ncbi:zinc ribbon domain-containing protein [Thioflexithrix psekupsensis]|uniref:DZANK-type domain-containing protein n=1 Tax=Thioflexithrix psekupsensis TaxID=1570016 RepID=A0A251X6M7_9GAMM|nr:zinc ribbon domain-containing protein [Thioflexithrix psekupsensis]OUD13557.1 hypothetical protein TPSD3_10235 [Thioflexithrix psekupsensis]